MACRTLSSSPGVPRPQVVVGGGGPGLSDREWLGKWPWHQKPFPDRDLSGAPAGTSPRLKRAGALSGRSRAWLRVPVPASQSRPSLQEEEAIPPSFWRAGQWAVRKAGDGWGRRGMGAIPHGASPLPTSSLLLVSSGPGPLVWRQFRPLLPSPYSSLFIHGLFLEHPDVSETINFRERSVRNHKLESSGSFHSHSCTLHLHSIPVPPPPRLLFSLLIPLHMLIPPILKPLPPPLYFG